MSSFDRVRGAIFGQAIGDALGAPTEGMTREAIVSTYGWLDDFVSEDAAGTDDTEYAVLTAELVLRHGHALRAANVADEWARLLVPQEGGFDGGGFSEMTAIHNLGKGMRPPDSGSDNHELWSDGSAMRTAPIGAFCAGDPVEAARLAAVDAQVSHAKDGVFCAQAIAAAVAVAVVSDTWEPVVEAGLEAVPADSWSRRTLERAIAIGSRTQGLPEALDQLYAEISIFYYPWADVAPEATALAFGVFAAARGEFAPSVQGGANVGRDADTIAAMAGAMAGGLRGSRAIPKRWLDQVAEIRGHCITATAGTRLDDLAQRIFEASNMVGEGDNA